MTGGGPAGTTTDWLRTQARALPQRLALVAGDARWTFAELDRRVDGTARRLASLGARDGARVALLLRNRAPYVVLAHALARLGAVMVPLNPRFAPAELTWQLADASPDVLVSEGDLTGRGIEASRSLQHLVHVAVGGTAVPDLDAVPEADAPLRRCIDLAAVQGIVYTSATSGRPKGALLTFGNHWWSAIGSALRLGLHDDDRWLAPLALSHVGGLAIVWRSAIYGITMVLHEGFDPTAVNREIDEGGVTIVSVVAAMLERILEARGGRFFPPSLRCVLLGGGPASADLLAACRRLNAPVAGTYGLTETASQVATAGPEETARTPGSAGHPLLPTRVRIEMAGRAAAVSEVGEILVAGPTVMSGYAGRPEETAQVLRDGWLHTGDLGYLDGEGRLYVVDRRDDLIITGGENVYPAEVEGVLRGHPAVADAAVIAIPDPAWGQAVGAVVVLRPAASVTPEELRMFCEGRLARYKHPRRMWFVSTLPRSPGGKLLRRELREWAAGSAPP
ncbi:MAG TPA: o-succinylbenzoate--CoA ligase [bacterium]|nr:o-succinylbenzoate--CoA ligase [bacterium]